jgi:hypothetical protein
MPVAPPEGFRPGDGVPVVALDPARSPDRWLLLGPFPFIAAEDVLKPLGGSAAARPVDGTKVFCRGESRAFKPLEARFVDAARGGVDVQRLLEGTTGSTLHLYTVIETARPVLVRFAAGHPNATVHLSGRRLTDDDFLEIGPGRHPLMVRFAIGTPWGTVRPRFAPVTAERVWKVLAARQSEYRASLEDWREDQAVWERTGGFHPHLMHLFTLGERQMIRYFQYALGDGGWQTEGEAYTLHSCSVALAYAHAYRTMFGRLPSPRPDVSRFAPRYVMQAVFPGDGNRPIALSDSLADGTLDPRHYARAFSVTEPSYRPAVLWAWDRRLEVGDEGEGGTLLEDDIWAMASACGGEGQDAAFAFVNRPLDLAPRNPTGILPLTWAAPTRGGYIFRDGWKGADDVVAQVYLKALPPNGWGRPTAGTIRLCGLGHVWGDDGAGNPKAGCRWLENVVMLPDDPINEGLGARLTHRETRPDGSGVIAFDLADVYAGAKWVQDAEGGERPARLTDQMYRVLREHLDDLGIGGMRSVAVDYGGSGGVPALLAVVDRVTGGGRKIWLWQVPGREREKPEVTIEGRAFAFRHGDVSLRATFVVPADVSLERVRGERWVRLPEGGSGEVMLDAVQATGAEVTNGDFFVVMTLQRGPAPEVKVEGEGLRAKVRIGRQVVAFDGKKLVLVNDGK